MGQPYDYYGKYWTMDTVAQANIFRKLDDVPMQVAGERYLIDRLEKVQAGVAMVRLMGHGHIQRMIQQVDPNLRLRWEHDHPDSNEYKRVSMFAIERYVRELGYNWTICYWSHPLGEGTAIRQVLREGDMQRPGYFEEKKLTRELILEQNAKKRTEIALASVDALTNKQCEEFVAVETALATGEKIHSRGKDAEMLNRMYEETRKRDAMGMPTIPGADQSLNPLWNSALRSQFRFGPGH